MKILKFTFLISLLLLVSCGKKDEPKLELFSTEAYAFDLGNGWDVNGTTRVKGFMQLENNGKYKSSLVYNIDLVKPDGNTVESIVSRTEDMVKSEKVADAGIETQFELDSTYAPGKYKLIFNMKDVSTGQTAKSTAEFELSR